jgi:nicotinate-nucleotide adenylyltransferase
MRVALFGGSFNPPHVVHQLVALTVLETKAVDELWFVPCFQHPFDKALAPFDDRLRMCELAAESLGPRVKVTDIEGRLGGRGRSYTLPMVQALRAERPEVEFALVLGSDLEPELDSWYGAQELRALVQLIVIGRKGYPGGSGIVMPELSSTQIRASLSRGEDVTGLVPRTVIEHIRVQGLYGAHTA